VRAVFCTTGGAPAAAVFDSLVSCERIQITGFIQSSRVLKANYSFPRGACEQVRLSGLRYALYLWTATSLADALLTLAGTGSVASLARRGAIPCLVTGNINGELEQRWLREVQPDLLISAFFNQRVGPEVLALPALGAVNIHPSKLPDFRGVDPVFHARAAGARSLGVTVHRMDPNFDTGRILASEELPIIDGESVLAATRRLYRRGGELLISQMDALAGGATGTPQPSGGRYDSWPTARDVAALRRLGIALVRPADLISLVSRPRSGP
jgi:methionyl-tRNA formyltransferase